jgi:hypothetical protein
MLLQLPYKTVEPSGETSERRWARFVTRALGGGGKAAVICSDDAVFYLTRCGKRRLCLAPVRHMRKRSFVAKTGSGQTRLFFKS